MLREREIKREKGSMELCAAILGNSCEKLREKNLTEFRIFSKDLQLESSSSLLCLKFPQHHYTKRKLEDSLKWNFFPTSLCLWGFGSLLTQSGYWFEIFWKSSYSPLNNGQQRCGCQGLMTFSSKYFIDYLHPPINIKNKFCKAIKKKLSFFTLREN